MPRVLDLTGQQFGRLTVLSRHGSNTRREATWTCACDCGGAVVVSANPLRRGCTRSCGCLARDLFMENRQTSPRLSNAGYVSAHHRIYRDRGSAADHACAECGEMAAHWALDHTASDIRTCDVIGAPFSLVPADYRPMCVPCHRLYDYAEAARA